MSNRAKKKGRKHRTVNRSPRPVTRRTAVAEPAVGRVPQQTSGPDLDRVLDRLGYRRLRVPAPATPDTRQDAGAETTPEASPEASPEVAPEVSSGASFGASPEVRSEAGPGASPVLAKNTLLTLERLQEASLGLTLEQLCEAVGWTPRTVTRHLKKLADSGLAEQAENGCWLASATAAAPVR
ncbi:winged helix-turn-helix domain-containing protein [Streptomyces sp. NPDC102340]|uniref:winged helix-turn-helix domain-containing protein n=1 Tax=unclassified Streptomyces TaxID=2593676 RepID=UPI0037F303A5